MQYLFIVFVYLSSLMACLTYAALSRECFKKFDESLVILYMSIRGSLIICELSSLAFLVFAWLKSSMTHLEKGVNPYHVLSINCWILAAVWAATFLLSVASTMVLDMESKAKGGLYLTKRIAAHTSLMAFILCVIGFMLY